MSRTLVSSVVFTLACAYGVTVAAQTPNAQVGTWKLNPAKSTYSPGPAQRSSTVRIETVASGGLKVTADTVDGTGRTTHNQIVTMLDGKEADYQGAAQPTTRAYTRIDDRTIQWVTKVKGKATTTTRSAVSPDGKSRTNTTTGTDEQGRQVKNVVLYERQ
jgi:hypothetical protein